MLSGSCVGRSNLCLAMMCSFWVVPEVPGWSGDVAARVEGEERRVDVEKGLLLPLAEGGVPEDGQLDRAADAFVRADDAGPEVELLGGDAERLGELLEHLGRGTPQTVLDLAQVGVGDPGLLGELPQGHAGRDPLLPEVVTE